MTSSEFMPQIYLASSSPRRSELLSQIRIRHEILEVRVSEQRHVEEVPEMYVLRLALDKARAGWKIVKNTSPLPVLGADTVVVVDDEILGKPANSEESMIMLEKLSGRQHHVYTGVALVSNTESTRLCVSMVTFRTMHHAERAAYCASGESFDKAGGYAIQGCGAAFVSHLAGSYSGVMGLPLYETAELLQESGINLFPDTADR
jgi:septum formation protein